MMIEGGGRLTDTLYSPLVELRLLYLLCPSRPCLLYRTLASDTYPAKRKSKLMWNWNGKKSMLDSERNRKSTNTPINLRRGTEIRRHRRLIWMRERSRVQCPSVYVWTVRMCVSMYVRLCATISHVMNFFRIQGLQTLLYSALPDSDLIYSTQYLRTLTTEIDTFNSCARVPVTGLSSTISGSSR